MLLPGKFFGHLQNNCKCLRFLSILPTNMSSETLFWCIITTIYSKKTDTFTQRDVSFTIALAAEPFMDGHGFIMDEVSEHCCCYWHGTILTQEMLWWHREKWVPHYWSVSSTPPSIWAMGANERARQPCDGDSRDEAWADDVTKSNQTVESLFEQTTLFLFI